MPLLNISAYRFFSIDDPSAGCEQLRSRSALLPSVRGTFIVTREGLNLFCAGETSEVRQMVDACTEIWPDFAGTPIKESWSEANPFRKLIIKTRKEAITLGEPTVDPARSTGPRLSPQEFKAWLDAHKGKFLLVDTRNDYEVALGTFAGAISPAIRSFREFPAWFRRELAEHKDMPIITFCTGGIRCEKATALMMQEGFREVYQIDGGILAYLEATSKDKGDNHWRGDCFVFDQRVAVDAKLRPAGYSLCYACWHTLQPEELKDPRTVSGKSCPYCYEAQKKRLEASHAEFEKRRRARHEKAVARGLALRKAYEKARESASSTETLPPPASHV